ncbi:MAG: hypothetical protein JEZ07_11155 [Phycisphaerae bacterium]|nr:hypothetical protein [Phycisphaerae bacterium]
MKKLMLLLILLFMAVAVEAATVWNPAANGIVPPATGKWSDGANWTNGVPDAVDAQGVALNDGKAVFNVEGAAECIVDYPDATCTQIVSGDNGPGGVLRIVDGGFITTRKDWSSMGYSNTGTWIVEEGGEMYIGSHLWTALRATGVGTLIINGGTIKIANALDLGRDAGSVAKVYLNEGYLQTRYFPDDSDNEGSVLDIRYGTFATTNNYTATDSPLWKRINAGTIVAFGGTSTLNVERKDGLTLVTAVDPMNVFPADGDVIRNGDVTLTWDNLAPLDPNGVATGEDVTVNVWFGTDPNKLDLVQYPQVVTDGVNTTSVAVTAGVAKYYWQIDTTFADGTVQVGHVYSFLATDDFPPVTDAGLDVISWSGNEVQLDADAGDDGTSTVTYAWTYDAPEGTTVTFSDTTIEDPTVTIDKTTEGMVNVTLTLACYDAANPTPVSDSLTVSVYDNACQAARVGDNQAGNYLADTNGDCVVDLNDFALLASLWMDDYTMENPITVLPEAEGVIE